MLLWGFLSAILTYGYLPWIDSSKARPVCVGWAATPPCYPTEGPMSGEEIHRRARAPRPGSHRYHGAGRRGGRASTHSAWTRSATRTASTAPPSPATALPTSRPTATRWRSACSWSASSLASDGMDPALRESVHDYLKYVWIHHGQYDHYTHTKFVPNSLTRRG